MLNIEYMHMTAGTSVTVEYSVVYPPVKEGEYNPCSVKEPLILGQPISVDITAGGTAFEVMEKAFGQNDAYKFTATYSTYGFFINAINGIPCAVIQSPPSQCFWGFFIKDPSGIVTASQVGVSTYEFNEDGYGMIMCFTNSLSMESFEKNCEGNSGQKIVKNEL